MRTRFVTVFCGLALILVACGPAATPVPTAVPTSLPTATLAPTSTPTPTPTATPTATATATPNATATLAAKATQHAEEVAASLKSDLEGLGIPVDTGSLAYYQLVPQTIELTDHNQALVDDLWLAEDLTASDFVISTDVTWKSPGLSTCGIIFRSEPSLTKGAQYLFQILRLSGLPAWDIEYFDETGWKNSPVRTKTSSAIEQGDGATNHIVLVVEGEKFTLYINDVRQGTYYDYSKQRLDGKLGYYAWQDTGSSSCTFENTTVWAY